MIDLFPVAGPLLRRLDPETAHGLTVSALKTGLVPASRAASAAISPSGAQAAKSRAAMLSSAAQTMIMSMISGRVLRTTTTPRRGTVRTKPSCSSRISASRTGVRLMPSLSEISRSSILISPPWLYGSIA